MSVLPFNGASTTTANGDIYKDGGLANVEKFVPQATTALMGYDVQRPRYEWHLYGGDRTDLNIWGQLASGQRVNARTYWQHWTFRYYKTWHQENALVRYGAGPHATYAPISSAVLHRKSDRRSFDFTGIVNNWGLGTNDGTKLTEGNIMVTLFGRSDTYGLDLGNSIDGWNYVPEVIPGGPVRTHPSPLPRTGNVNGWEWMGGSYMANNYNPHHSLVFDPNIRSHFLPPAEYFSGSNQKSNHLDPDPTPRFENFTFICYDTVTDEFVPPSEIDVDWEGDEMDVCTPVQQGLFTVSENQYLLSTTLAVHLNDYISKRGGIDTTITNPGKIDVGSTGSLTFKANFDDHAEYTGFTRFVEYNRPLNLDTPFYAHQGYSVTVTEDRSNRLIMYDEKAYDILSLAVLLGPSTYAEWFAPNIPAGHGFTPHYSQLSNNIVKLDHQNPTINAQFSLTPPDLTVGGAQRSHKMFGDLANSNYDYVLSTADGINYRHAVGFKHYNFIGESFGCLTGSNESYIPILVGMISINAPAWTGSMPHVSVTRSIV